MAERGVSGAGNMSFTLELGVDGSAPAVDWEEAESSDSS